MTINLQETGQDTVELDFEVPEKGVSTCQIEEGIQSYTNDTSGKTSLRIPMSIDKVEEGPDNNLGLKLSHFVPIETGWGEKQMAGILTVTGLMNACIEKFGSQVDATSESFINWLKLKLPGKFIRVHHDVRKDNNSKQRAKVTRFEKLNKTLKPVEENKEGTKDSAEPKSAEW
jgi:hypothetical protein